jgi:hypothetical protein
MRLERFRNFVADKWQPVILYGGMFAVMGGLLFFRIGSLLPGYSASEVQTYHASSGFRHIFEHPTDAPFTLVTHLMTLISEHSFLLTRLTAVLFGLATLIAFWWLLQHWYDRRVAFFGTVLFGSSAWFLHTTRFGAPDVLMFLVVMLIACGVWLKKSSNPIALFLCFGLGTALLYVPGMVWVVVLGVIWQWRTIDRIFRSHLWLVTLGGLFLASALAPLGLALYRSPEIWKTLIGLPATGWPQLGEVLSNLYQIPMAFLFRYVDASPETWLGNLAILDIFSIAMLFLGGYVFVRHASLQRVKLMAWAMVAGITLVSLGGGVSLSVLVPFVYILIAAGVGLLCNRWFEVFPRNPIAHILGLVLVSLAVLTACSYQLRHYFVAWPRNPETRSVYTVPELPTSDTIKQ